MGNLLLYLCYTLICLSIIIIYYIARVIKKKQKKLTRILWTYRQHTRTLHHDCRIIWMDAAATDGQRAYSQPLCARIMCVSNFSSWGIFTLAQWGRNLADLCSNFYRLIARTLHATRVIILRTGSHSGFTALCRGSISTA
jgi:hypothetical protein